MDGLTIKSSYMPPTPEFLITFGQDMKDIRFCRLPYREPVAASEIPSDATIAINRYVVDCYLVEGKSTIDIGPYRLRLLPKPHYLYESWMGVLDNRGSAWRVFKYRAAHWWDTFKRRIRMTWNIWRRKDLR